MKVKKILVVACIHGNEKFGLKVLANLTDNAMTIVAHPEAIAKNKRFVQTDLNRSFKLPANTSTESRIARSLISNITEVNPDLIIDLHTSTVDVGKAAIVSEKNPLLINVAKHLGVKKIAVMPTRIAEKSLIGVFPEKSICIELGKGLRSDTLAKSLAEKITDLQISGMENISESISMLLIERIIERAEAAELKLSNYIFNERLGGYPFLTGESNYSEHRGFLATTQIEV